MSSNPSNLSEYIAASPPASRLALSRIRQIVQQQVPHAEECISYKMPAFRDGRVFVYFAAFKNHIGMYPPVTNDSELILALAAYRNAKGNLRFPLDQVIPDELLTRVVKALHSQYARNSGAKPSS